MRRALLLLVVAAPLAAQDAKKPDAKDPLRVVCAVPLAVAPGFKGKVLLRGVKLDEATEVRAGDPRAKVKLVGKPKKSAGPKGYPAERVGDSEAEVELELPKDFPAGPLGLTVVGPKGTSEAFALTVDGSPRTAEKEPNGSFAQAQELTLPATVDGAVGSDFDVDVYRFAAKAGEKVRVEAKASRLGSPLDALVVVYDEGKRTIDSADDTDGNPDPVFTFTVPRAGVYFVSVIDSHDAGGPLVAYRLSIAPAK